MAVHVLKDQEQKSQSQSNGITQTKRTDTSPINIYDQNFEADAQNSVSGLGNTDYGVSRLSSLQNKANSSTKITQLAELQKKADQHTIQTKSKYQKNNSNKDNVIQLMGGGVGALRGVGSALRTFAPAAARSAAGKASNFGVGVANKAAGMAKTFGENTLSAAKQAGLIGTLGTGIGVANAGYDAYKAYKDPNTKGVVKTGNVVLNAATGVPGTVGPVASAIKAGMTMYDTLNEKKGEDGTTGLGGYSTLGQIGVRDMYANNFENSPVKTEADDVDPSKKSILDDALRVKTDPYEFLLQVGSLYSGKLDLNILNQVISNGTRLFDAKSALNNYKEIMKKQAGTAATPTVADATSTSPAAAETKVSTPTIDPIKTLTPTATSGTSAPPTAAVETKVSAPTIDPIKTPTPSATSGTSATPTVADETSTGPAAAETKVSTPTIDPIKTPTPTATSGTSATSTAVVPRRLIVDIKTLKNPNPVLTPYTSQSEEQEPNPEKGLDLREIRKILESNYPIFTSIIGKI